MIQSTILDERHQRHPTRSKLYNDIEEIIKKPVISFFTSFVYPVMIEDSDADMLEGLLRDADLDKGLALLISSPGGDGLAAERIINICRSYSGTGEYETIIPGKAKSAATLICMGSSKLNMSPTSELGPVDPQIVMVIDGVKRRFSAYNLVKGYGDLFDSAINSKKQKLEPYLQQLSRYDDREIQEFKVAINLSEDITVKALKSGMLSDMDDEKIKEKVAVFLNPSQTKVHGRALFSADTKKCGLKVTTHKPRSKLWDLVYELYLRTNDFVSTGNIAKCIENKDHSFIASVDKTGGDHDA